MTKKVLAIYRAHCFSPNAVSRDEAILTAVCSRLQAEGCAVTGINEDDMMEQPAGSYNAAHYDMVLTMGRRADCRQLLAEAEAAGLKVINSAKALQQCSRRHIDTLMRRHDIPCAPVQGHYGHWLKRGDEAAQQHGDVVFVPPGGDMQAVMKRFACRGITDVVTTAHVRGDVVKFYGVGGTPFFRCAYPTDGAYSKFGDETVNGMAHHYAFNRQALQADANRLAALLGIDVYGGDCIVEPTGRYCIIDFNDWPSFACCRQEAAEAIAELGIADITA